MNKIELIQQRAAFNDALNAMTDSEYVALKHYADFVSSSLNLPSSGDDLIQEASLRIWSGERVLPSDIAVGRVLRQIIRSLVSDLCKKRKRRPDEFSLEDKHDRAQLPEDYESFKDDRTRKILEYFKDDDTATYIIEALLDGFSRTETAADLNLTPEKYDVHRRRISRYAHRLNQGDT